MKDYKFEAVIKASEIGKGGAYIEFPYDVEKEFGVKGRVSVVSYFNDIEYRGSLVKMGTNCHIIGVLKEIRQKLNKDIGDTINVIIMKDESKRVVEIHHLLKSELNNNSLLEKNYNKLSYTMQKEINEQLTNPKNDDTRKKRLDKIINELLEK